MPQIVEQGAGALVFIHGAGGIGRALAMELLQRYSGLRVWLTSRRSAQDPKLSGLAQEYADRVRILQVDLFEPESIVAVTNAITEAGLSLQWVISTSGILHQGDELQPERKLEALEAASLEVVFRANCFAPMLLGRTLLPLMERNTDTLFAVISARVGSIGDNRLGGWYAYRSSKAALNMFVKTLSIEARRRWKTLTCLALHPGTTDTPLSTPFQKNVPPGKLFSPQKTAAYLVDVMVGADTRQSGQLLAYDGSVIPW